MELLKIILDFLSKIAYPVIICIAFILFRKELAGIFVVLTGILESVKSGRLPVSVGNVAVGKLAETAARQIQKEDLGSAAKTIQKLLSPAAPLALGYVDNFLKGFKVKHEGGFLLNVVGDVPNPGYNIRPVFTIYIPHKLSDIDSSSKDLVRDKYPLEQIKNISIQSTEGRPFTGFAVLRANQLYPVDVPKTLTSIRHVFRFRQKQLKVEGMADEEIERLENENLDEFANIIKERTRDLQEKRCVRVVREQSELFSSDSNAG